MSEGTEDRRFGRGKAHLRVVLDFGTPLTPALSLAEIEARIVAEPATPLVELPPIPPGPGRPRRTAPRRLPKSGFRP
jgi:hypothetical protein